MFQTIKINWGPLKELPQISVNKFLIPKTLTDGHEVTFPRAFIMTHYDHEILLEVTSWGFLHTLQTQEVNNVPRLYLHELTFEFILYWLRLRVMKNLNEVPTTLLPKVKILNDLKASGRIICLQTDVPIRLKFQGLEKGASNPPEDVDLTPISSGHNLGSIMLLLEFQPPGEVETKRILYTGACRLTLRDLEMSSSLRTNDGSIKTLSHIYIDTTNCLNMSESRDLPGRGRITKDLLNFIQATSSRGNLIPRFEFITSFDQPISNFNVLVQIFLKFGERVHVPKCVYEFLSKINLRLKDSISPDDPDYSLRFHYTCCDGLEMDMEWVDRFEPFEVVLTEEIGRLVDEKTPIKIQDTCLIIGLYSTHLSRFELCRLIKYFSLSPEKVTPLFTKSGIWEEELRLLIIESCSEVTEEPSDLLDELPCQAFDFTSLSSSAREAHLFGTLDDPALSVYKHY